MCQPPRSASWSTWPDGVDMDEDERRQYKKEIDDLEKEFEALCDARTVSQARNALPLNPILLSVSSSEADRNQCATTVIPTSYCAVNLRWGVAL